MKKNWGVVAVVLSALFSATYARGEIITFAIDSNASSLSLSGEAEVQGAGVFTFGEQGPGSLVTAFSGTITLEVNNFSNPTSITFVSANISALVNGQWAPAIGAGGMSPAADGNYGVSTAFGAGAWRDLSFNLGNGGTTTVDASGNFFHSEQAWSHSGGQFEIFSPILGTGSSSNLTAIASATVNNSAAAQGSYISGTTATLTLPVDIDFNFLVPGSPDVSGNMRYVGTITATAVPEPGTILLLTASGIALPLMRRRKKHLSSK